MQGKKIRVLCPTCMDCMFRDDKDKDGDVTTIWYLCPDCGKGAVQTRVKGIVVRTNFYNADGDKIKTVGGIDNEVVLQLD